MKVLCLGYSVTELTGYVDLCTDHFTSRDDGISVIKSGWGGHTIDTIAYFIDELLSTVDCDRVVLEIFTSHIRTLGAEKIKFYLDTILVALAKREKRIAFLYLFDGSVDYSSDYLTEIVIDYSRRYEIPLINLALEIARMDDATRSLYFWDNVHNTSEGAAFYSAAVIAFIDSDSFGYTYAAAFRHRELLLRSLNLETLALDGPYHVLTRNGPPWRFYEIEQARSLTLTLPEPMHIAGMMLAYAPDSGPVDVVTDEDRQPKRVLPHDVWSYYIRSGFFEVDIRARRSVTLFQTDIVPDCEPLKGEKSFAARVGRISHIFYRIDAKPGSISRLKRAMRSLIGLGDGSA